jgi:hypothetical protein
VNTLPEVLIGGFPNSGTSFLCSVIVQLGKSPGSEHNLKAGDAHNRWGYYEHLPIRDAAWRAAGFERFEPQLPGFLPLEPLAFGAGGQSNPCEAIQRLAMEDRVQVYKDNALPLLFRLFPEDGKYIVIERDVAAVFRSPLKAGLPGYTCSVSELAQYQAHYHQLVHRMCGEVDCLSVKYEEFHRDFPGVLGKIAEHLRMDLRDVDYANCSALFRPRPRSRWADSLISGRSALRKGARILGRQVIEGLRRNVVD